MTPSPTASAPLEEPDEMDLDLYVFQFFLKANVKDVLFLLNVYCIILWQAFFNDFFYIIVS